MNVPGLALQPLLRRHPDARRSGIPLLDPILLPYVALMLGSGVAALAACYNALLLRRAGLALRSIFLAVVGWVLFLVVVVGTRRAGLENLAVGLILGRVVHFACGGVLYWMQRPYFRGHQFLRGPVIPMLASYLVALLVSMKLPVKVTLLLLGVPFVR